MNRTAQEIADELYAVTPQAFTAARDSYVHEARHAGDRRLASELARLRRPSVAAWLVNLVALHRPQLLQSLVDLGRITRQAQGSGSPAQLRDLSAQRRRELDAVLVEAQSLAAERGETAVSRAHLVEAESTFAAAMADEKAASLVCSGRVRKALSYNGFGDTDTDTPDTGDRGEHGDSGTLDRIATQQRPAGPGLASPQSAPDQRAREEKLARAQQLLTQAQELLGRASAAEEDAAERVARLAAEVTELTIRLEGARRAATAARQSRIEAEREVVAAQRWWYQLG